MNIFFSEYEYNTLECYSLGFDGFLDFRLVAGIW